MVKDVVQRAIAQMREGKRELEPSDMLWGKGLYGEDANAIAEELKVNASLTTLYLDDNEIEDEGASTIAEVLKVNASLNSFGLYNNTIGDVGASKIAEALKVNASLTTLDLHTNSIGSKGASSIAEALNVNTTFYYSFKSNASLTSLDLSGNNIGPEGASSFAEALKVNASLTCLELAGNEIGPEGASSIAEALKVNASLTSLDLGSNSIGPEGASSIAEALEVNASLTELDLYSNSISPEGASSIAEALKANASMTSLDLQYNSIGDSSASSIAEALKVNASLTKRIAAVDYDFDALRAAADGSLASAGGFATLARVQHAVIARLVSLLHSSDGDLVSVVTCARDLADGPLRDHVAIDSLRKALFHLGKMEGCSENPAADRVGDTAASLEDVLRATGPPGHALCEFLAVSQSKAQVVSGADGAIAPPDIVRRTPVLAGWGDCAAAVVDGAARIAAFGSDHDLAAALDAVNDAERRLGELNEALDRCSVIAPSAANGSTGLDEAKRARDTARAAFVKAADAAVRAVDAVGAKKMIDIAEALAREADKTEHTLALAPRIDGDVEGSGADGGDESGETLAEEAVARAAEELRMWARSAVAFTASAQSAAAEAGRELADAQDAVGALIRDPTLAYRGGDDGEEDGDDAARTTIFARLSAVAEASFLLMEASRAVRDATDADEIVVTFPHALVLSALTAAVSSLGEHAERLTSAVRAAEHLAEAAEEHRLWVGVSAPTVEEDSHSAAKALRKARRNLKKADERAVRHADGDSDSDSGAGPPPTDEELRELRRNVSRTAREADAASLRAVRVAQDHFPELRARVLAQAGALRDVYESQGLIFDRSMADYLVDAKPLAVAGHGARHTVYAAEYDGARRALKKFEKAATVDGDAGRRRFVREVSNLKRVAHPYVAEVGCVFFDDKGDAYLDMPLYTGGDLAAWLASRDRPYVERHRVLAYVARGLEYIHRVGITHCDVKPQNVFMESDEDGAVPRVADFDASRDERGRRSELLSTASMSMGLGAVAGTLFYMAPELFRQDASVESLTSAVDVYALGVTIAEVLAPASCASLRGGQVRPGNVFPADQVEFPADVVAHGILMDLLVRMCDAEPSRRPSMTEVIEHPFFSASLREERAAVTQRATALAAEAERVEARRAQLSAKRAEIDARAKSATEERRKAERTIAEARCRGSEVDAKMRKAEADARRKEREIAETRRAAEAEASAIAKDRASLISARSKLEKERSGVRKKETDVAAREVHITRMHRHLAVPRHWTAVSSLAATRPAARVDVTHELKGSIEQLMNETSKKENGWIVGGRDNPSLKHRGYRIVRVTRIENPRVMRVYAFQRDHLSSLNPPRTNVASYNKDLWRAVNQDKGGNEVLLFHACKPEIAGVIVEQGFDERVCGLNGLFGAAVYFAENASKSGEYAVEDPRKGTAFMFLSRVALGRPHERPPQMHLNNQRRAPCLHGGHTDCTHERADSVVCVGSARFGYREFMVYDRRQAYPELLIEFKRV
eukprot:TRINITY_DN239_c1_g2_i3.p1 TRINITY_DN239_c1_g2~~TRINITY_DN239_c1_g2_i3.p1  ORF type:complete len:1507 (-),score=409.47 TRINITY_DN239_c1_g2_i3:10-4530(-)